MLLGMQPIEQKARYAWATWQQNSLKANDPPNFRLADRGVTQARFSGIIHRVQLPSKNYTQIEGQLAFSSTICK